MKPLFTYLFLLSFLAANHLSAQIPLPPQQAELNVFEQLDECITTSNFMLARVLRTNTISGEILDEFTNGELLLHPDCQANDDAQSSIRLYIRGACGRLVSEYLDDFTVEFSWVDERQTTPLATNAPLEKEANGRFITYFRWSDLGITSPEQPLSGQLRVALRRNPTGPSSTVILADYWPLTEQTLTLINDETELRRRIMERATDRWLDEAALTPYDDNYRLCGRTNGNIQLGLNYSWSAEEIQADSLLLVVDVTDPGNENGTIVAGRYAIYATNSPRTLEELQFRTVEYTGELLDNALTQIRTLQPQANSCVYPTFQATAQEEKIRVYGYSNCMFRQVRDEPQRVSLSMINSISFSSDFPGCADTDVQAAIAFDEGSCMANLSVPVEPTAGIAYRWEDTEGNTIYGPQLTGAAEGLYTLIITNECRNETRQLVSVCGSTTAIGEWAPTQDLSEYCQQISCATADCDGYSTDVCFTPEFTDWRYDAATGTVWRTARCPFDTYCEGFVDGTEQRIPAEYGEWDYREEFGRITCFRPVFAQGARIFGDDIGQTYLTYDYVAEEDRCYRIIRCEDPLTDPTGVDDALPTYGDWDYEDDAFDLGSCFREVFCFGEDGDLIDREDGQQGNWEFENLEPVIVWEYDDFGITDCAGLVYCDEDDWTSSSFDVDIELDGDPIAYNVGIDDFFGDVTCDVQVFCEYNFDEYDTGYIEEEEIDPWLVVFIGVPTNGGFCQLHYECDPYSTIVNEDFVYEYSYTSNDVDFCVAYCEADEFITRQPAVPCADLGVLPQAGKDETSVGGATIDLGKSISVNPAPEVYPNPFIDNIRLRNLPLVDGEPYVLQWVAVSGQVAKQVALRGGQPHYKVSIPGVATGMYQLQVLNSDQQMVWQTRVVKR